MTEPALGAAAVITALAFGWRLASAGPGATPSAPERLFLAASWSYLLLGWAGVVLAEAGLFGAPMLLAASLAGLALSWRAGAWRAARAAGARQGGYVAWLAWLLAVGLTLALATPLVDARYEARDAGVYRLTAARLQSGGSWMFEDELVADLPAELRARAFPRPEGRSASRGMGFYLEQPERGLVVPQFQPLPAVVMAVGRLLAGPRGAEGAILVVAVLGLLAIALVGRDLGGWGAGLLSLLWTGGNIAIWWFVRYGTGEPFALLLVFIGLYALCRERRDDSVRAGLLAGWALGLLWLCKLEMLLLGVPLGLLFLYDIGTARIRTRSTRVFWAVLFLLAGHFFVHAWGWSYPYIRDVLLVPDVTLGAVTVAAATLTAAALLLWAWRLRSEASAPHWLLEYDGREGGLAKRANALVLVALTALLLYGYGFRAPGWDQYNVRDLGWVVSEIGLLAALGGAGWLLLGRSRPAGSGAPLLVMLAMTVAVLYNRQIIPDLLWAYRRYAVFAVPTSALLAAVAVAQLAGWAMRRLQGSAAMRRDPASGSRPQLELSSRLVAVVALLVAAGVAAAVTAREAGLAARYRAVRDLAGAAGLIDSLEATIEPDAVVIFEPRTRRGLLRLEGVLQHELGIGVLRLPEPEIDRELVQQLLFSASRAGRPVYLMTSGYLVAADWLDAEMAARFVLDSHTLDEPGEELPEREMRLLLDARLYRLRPGGGLAALDGRLDVGEVDDLYLDGRSVHQVETEEGGRDYRWTYAAGSFFLPGISRADARILIRMASSYPPELGEQTVRVRLDGIDLGEVVVGRGWRDYSFDIPPRWAPSPDTMPRLELVADPTWRPEELLASTDPRDVGVAVDLIRWGQ